MLYLKCVMYILKKNKKQTDFHVHVAKSWLHHL